MATEVYEKKRVFVAMPFAAPHSDTLWEIIKFVCDRQGFQTTRADQFVQPRMIISDIREGIERADIVIADLTHENANVYYELGLAHASCESVLLVCQEGQELPFDVEGVRCLFFNVSTPSGQRTFTDALWAALESIKAPDMPTVIRTRLARTHSIVSDLKALMSYPKEAVRKQCVWFSGFLSTLAISEREIFTQEEDRTYQEALFEEKRLLLELANAGCELRMIVTPPLSDDFMTERRDTALLRLETLRDFLIQPMVEGRENIEFVVSPFRQKNLYIIGHLCASEGFKLGRGRGYELTLRQSGYEAVSASIAAQAILFEEAKVYTLSTYAGAQFHSERLRSSVIDAVNQSLSFCRGIEATH